MIIRATSTVATVERLLHGRERRRRFRAAQCIIHDNKLLQVLQFVYSPGKHDLLTVVGFSSAGDRTLYLVALYHCGTSSRAQKGATEWEECCGKRHSDKYLKDKNAIVRWQMVCVWLEWPRNIACDNLHI